MRVFLFCTQSAEACCLFRIRVKVQLVLRFSTKPVCAHPFCVHTTLLRLLSLHAAGARCRLINTVREWTARTVKSHAQGHVNPMNPSLSRNSRPLIPQCRFIKFTMSLQRFESSGSYIRPCAVTVQRHGFTHLHAFLNCRCVSHRACAAQVDAGI